MTFSYASLKDGYLQTIEKLEITRPQAVNRQVRHLLALRSGTPNRYVDVANQTKIALSWLLAIDYRESDNDPTTYFGNGDHVIANGRKTTDVPRGRGPFATWQEGALDSLHGIPDNADWNISYAAWQAERWNGYGYRRRGVPSPYLWAGTSAYTSGKYVKDGVYDPNAVDQQLGIVPLMLALGELEEDLALAME